jgi:hypothetical protein
MNLLSTTAMRHFASTFFVFLALFVVCAGVQAMPCERQASSMTDQHYVPHTSGTLDGAATLDDQDPIPSIEDHGGGLDDTFDAPPHYAVKMLHLIAGRPAGLVPAPHAHHPSLDLRPPIA